MTETNRGNRPLSPHLTIYRPELNSTLSILHRVTGVGLTLGAALCVWWFLAAATGADDFARADGVLTGWLGGPVLVLSMVALWYHACNGVRHLLWDAGFGFELPTTRRTALAAGVATFLLSAATLFAAFW